MFFVEIITSLSKHIHKIRNLHKGVVSLASNDNVFTFDIDESFYFDQDQRVQNMLNLSIHPEITIEKTDDYVSIRGVLEVMGEYIKEKSEKEVDLRGDFTRRYITDIKELGNDYNQFSQLIPVQITVPLYRVENFEDLTAEITKFDYEISDKEHLFLRAELSIYGIDPSENKASRIKEKTEIENFELDRKMETAKPAKEEVNEEKGEEEALANIEEGLVELREENLQAEESKEKKTDQADDLALVDFKEERVELEEVMPKNEDGDPADIPSAASFLSSLFEVKDEANYSKIRLCIVQEGDTLERISERFEIPSLQIIQYNGLDDGNLQAGELLYIPNRKRKTN